MAKARRHTAWAFSPSGNDRVWICVPSMWFLGFRAFWRRRISIRAFPTVFVNECCP